MIFFRSLWKIPVKEAKKAVKEPIIISKLSVKEENSNNGEKRIIKNTPAVTIVAAWINADTGVGPSIASGNHTCKPNWADLPTAPKNKKKPKNDRNERLKVKMVRFNVSNSGAIEKSVW